MKKKLVQINVVCNGSTGRIMTQIQQHAIENGWEAYSFYGRGKSANNYCYKICNKLDILWSIFLTRVFDKHGYGCKRATKRLIKKIEEINPDVIQLHNIHGYYLNIKILFNYLKKCNKKIIWTLHDCWAFTGHCAYFTELNCCEWKKQCKNCPQKTSYPASNLIDNSRKTFNIKKELFTGINNLKIITPSKWLANLVKQSFLSNYDVKVINNGINLEIFKPTTTIDVRKKYNIAVHKKIILGVAAIWDRRKGLNEFIELNKYINEEFQIVLVGLNKKQIKKLPKNMIGIERTENIEELANLYSLADIFVNPTFEDNFPTTNLEALACGTPVITYDTGGSAECLDQYVGKKIHTGDIKSLFDAINQINKNSEVCCSRAQEYDSKIAYSKYLKIYNE